MVDLNASKETQIFTGTSTIDQYDYSMSDSEFFSIYQNNQAIPSIFNRRESIELCLKKLNAINLPILDDKRINNCFRKLTAVQFSLN